MTQIKRSDPDFALIPWYAVSTVGPITTPELIPNDFNALQVYSPRLNPSRTKLKQKVYASLHLRRFNDFVDLQQNLANWFGDGDL